MSDWDWKAILFGFAGRLNRAKFWLVGILLNLVGSFVGNVTLALVEMSGGQADPVFWIGIAATLILLVAFFWMSFAISVKRLHDRARTGLWLLAFYGLPFAALALAMAVPGMDWVVFLIIVIVVIWATVELGFLKGTTGPNMYGPDPLTVAPKTTPPVL